MARATNSLPVPVAPVIRTELSESASLSISEKTFCITGDCPIKLARTASGREFSRGDQGFNSARGEEKSVLEGAWGCIILFQNTQESVAESSRLSFKTTTRRPLPLAGASSLFDVIGIFLKNLRFWRPQRRISGNLFRVTGCSNAPCCPVLKLREQGPGLFNKLGAKPIEKRLTLWGGFITRPQLKS